MSRSRLYPPSVDPGFPVLPPCPGGWQRRTFRDVVEVVERPVKLESDRVYKLVTAKRSRGGIVLRSETPGREVLTKTQFETRAGDFLISRRQIIHGACGVVPEDLDGAVVSNEYAALRTRPGLSMEFLRHYSHTPYFQRTCFHSSHGVDVEKMIFKLDEWLAREVDVPPLAEQRKIAAILSSIDETIERTRAVIDQVQVSKTALTAELLTRGLPGRHTRFKQTAIGVLPEDWGVVRLQDLAVVQTGLAKGKQVTQGVELPYLRVANVQDGYVALSEVKHIVVEHEAVSRYSLKAGDVLFTEGGDADKLGRGCVWRAQIEPCLHQNHVFAVRTDRQRLLPEFLAYFAASPGGKAYFLECAKQTTNLASINSTQLKSLPVPLASIKEQAEIVEILQFVDSRLEFERCFCRHLARVKESVMFALLTGEVRVPLDEVTP